MIFETVQLGMYGQGTSHQSRQWFEACCQMIDLGFKLGVEAHVGCRTPRVVQTRGDRLDSPLAPKRLLLLAAGKVRTD